MHDHLYIQKAPSPEFGQTGTCLKNEDINTADLNFQLKGY